MKNEKQSKRLKIEKKIYEILGVKVFRKLVFLLEKFLHFKDKKQNVNYHIKRKNLKAVQDFKKYLFYNGSIHVKNLIIGSIIILIMTIFSVNKEFLLGVGVFLLKDLYCVMLQRYNWIRICETEKKLIAHREKKISKEEQKEYNFIKENIEEQKIRDEIEVLNQIKEFLIEQKNAEITSENKEVIEQLNIKKSKIRRK